MRQWRRHTVFIGVSCHSPAAIKMAAPSQTVVVSSIGDSSRALSSAHCSATATSAEAAPRNQVPEGEQAGRNQQRTVPLCCWRLTRANSSSIGAALGSIIATIITHHMENISTA